MRARFLANFLLAVGAFSIGGCDEDLLNPMAARQPRVGFYQPSEFYEDGLSMRHPPEGTVPRERMVMNPSLTSGKVPGMAATYVTSFPLKVDWELVELGRKRYNITCGTCHGPAGDGDSIVGRQMALKPPPSLLLFAGRPVGYLFEVATNGFGMMASYAAELPVRERWAVVAYIRALQLSQAVPIDKAPPEEQMKLRGTP